MKRTLRKMTKDTLSTLIGAVGGLVLGAVGGAAQAVANGGVTKEAVITGAAIGTASAVAGYLHNKGNTETVVK